MANAKKERLNAYKRSTRYRETLVEKIDSEWATHTDRELFDQEWDISSEKHRTKLIGVIKRSIRVVAGRGFDREPTIRRRMIIRQLFDLWLSVEQAKIN